MKEVLLRIETHLIETLKWPSWALRLIAVLVALVVATGVLEQIVAASTSPKESTSNKKNSADNTEKAPLTMTWAFRLFQLQYLTVYLLTMLADWLQGTNMYTLYSSYGVNVGTLFLTGFLSSAIFGTFLGIYVDRWGRRWGCILFCILEIVINLMEHIPNMPALMVGRILGGLSTSLLFTAFESWMVSEHRRRGFSEDWLASTFSFSSAGNGIMAIGAGICAQIAADISGDIGPFQLAIALTVVTLVFIVFWKENYGSEHDNVGSIWHSIMSSTKMIRSHRGILFLGLSQAFFEGAIFSFVFMWVPTLISVNPEGYGSLPTGLVFSAFMLAMTIGGMLFAILLPIFPGGAEGLCVMVFIVAAGAMFTPIYYFDFWSMLYAFLVLEAMVGMFNSCGATLRARYYPDSMQSSIMSVFRLPLNILVVIGTNLANKASNESEMKSVFAVIVGKHLVAALFQLIALKYGPPTDVAIHYDSKDTQSKKKNE